MTAIDENGKRTIDELVTELLVFRDRRGARGEQIRLQSLESALDDGADEALSAAEVMKYCGVGYADVFRDLLEPDPGWTELPELLFGGVENFTPGLVGGAPQAFRFFLRRSHLTAGS